jgi:selenophosphate synthetase-related protein
VSGLRSARAEFPDTLSFVDDAKSKVGDAIVAIADLQGELEDGAPLERETKRSLARANRLLRLARLALNGAQRAASTPEPTRARS